MTTVSCTDIHGNSVDIAREKLTFRPSAYGLIINDGHLLVSTMRQTGRYTLPGGAMECGETILDAIRRETHEECGIEVDIQNIHSFTEFFGYYNPGDRAWHVHAFFAIGSPKSLVVTDANNVADDDSEKPHWVPIHDLAEDQFQIFGKEIMNILRSL